MAASTDLDTYVDYCRVRPYVEACQFETKCFVGGSVGYVSGSDVISPIFNVNATSHDNGGDEPYVVWDNGFTYVLNESAFGFSVTCLITDFLDDAPPCATIRLLHLKCTFYQPARLISHPLSSTV